MKVEVLISAMNLNNTDIAESSRCKSDVLIVNQTNTDGIIEINNPLRVRMISTKERGLAKSRNMAIKNAEGDICLICDDDETLVDNYVDIIKEAFSSNCKADIIAFDVKKDSLSSAKPRYKKILNYGNSKQVRKAPPFKTYSSVQLAFKRKSILDNEIFFDSRFGAGSNKISAGDETVWQVLAKKRGLRIYYVPKTIAYIRQEESQWFSGLNKKYYYDIGACLGHNYPCMCHLLKYYYVFFIIGSDLSIFEKINSLNAGIKWFKRKEFSFDEYLSFKNNR